MRTKDYCKFCKTCGDKFWSSKRWARFCEPKCAYGFHNERAKRLSLKLKPEQLDVLLALQDYFIRDYTRPVFDE